MEPKYPHANGSLLCFDLDLNSSSSDQNSDPTAIHPSLLWRYPASAWNLPAVADVNGDSIPEVFLATLDGRIACLSSGRPLWRLSGGGPFYASPALADLDADGTLELLVAGRDHFLYCLNAATGDVKWRFLAGGQIDSSPAVAGLQGNPELAVAFGCDDGFLYCLSGSKGHLLWRFRTDGWVTAPPTIADLQADGSPEVLVGDDTGTFYCLNGATGEQIWAFHTSQPIASEATAADLNGDGRKQVFFGSDALYSLDSSGNLLWRFAPGEHFSATPLLLSGKAGGWVIIPGENLYCLDAATGIPLWQRSLSSRGLFDASAYLDPGGNLFISVASGFGELFLLRSQSHSAVTSLPWPKPRANLLNTGSAP
jgi:outer membrane protein assembly factor BamB